MDGSGLIARVAALHARIYGATYWLVRRALPAGPLNHTITVVLLAALGALILLSALDLFWLLGGISDPYLPSDVNGRHVWIWSAAVISVELNVLLGRRSFRAMGCRERPMRRNRAGAEPV